MNLDLNKSLWKIPDIFEVYFALATNLQKIFESARINDSLSEQEIANLEESADLLNATMEQSESMGYKIDDPLFYWFLLCANSLVLGSKYKYLITDERLVPFRGSIPQNKITVLASQLQSLLKNDHSLSAPILRYGHIAFSASTGISYHNKYPSYTKEMIDIIISAAHQYALLGNDSWIEEEGANIKGVSA